MAARAKKRSSSTRKASIVTPNPEQNKRRKQNNAQPLGLQPLSNKNATVFHLKVGNILGRKPTKPTKPSQFSTRTEVRHVDVGISDAHIPRKFLQISKVSSTNLELKAFFDETEKDQEMANKNQRKCSNVARQVCKVKRNGHAVAVDASKSIVLQEHDIFQIEKRNKQCDMCYHFRVVRTDQPSKQVIPEQPPFEQQQPDIAEANQQPMLVSDQYKEQGKAAAALGKKLDKLEKKLGFRPYRPTRKIGHRLPHVVTPVKRDIIKHDSLTAPVESQEVDESDSDDDGDHVDSKKESSMHATLASTYWKALQTANPHYGAGFLHLILSKNEFPTPDLLQDLIKLLTFGPTYQQDYAFYEGNRLQLAMEYVRDLLEEHPGIMGPRFFQAASQVAEDVDYWNLLLDQLTVLAYAKSSAPIPANETREEVEQKRLVQSLEMHAVSLHFFLLLLKQESTGLLHQVQRNSKQVVRHYVQIMATVWVERGYYLLGEEGQRLADVMEQVTGLLTQVLGYVTNHSNFRQPELVDMLWSAMEVKFREKVNKDAMNNRRQVLLKWVCNLEGLIHMDEKWGNITNTLIGRARLRKEYNALSK